jgi:hypothetical protein
MGGGGRWCTEQEVHEHKEMHSSSEKKCNKKLCNTLNRKAQSGAGEEDVHPRRCCKTVMGKLKF